uniref:Uncharacterized protein n=1 Tax=Aplanochytrium stocchinoi TaxID=215587 RepID=A0A7S3V090_9STRA
MERKRKQAAKRVLLIQSVVRAMKGKQEFQRRKTKVIDLQRQAKLLKTKQEARKRLKEKRNKCSCKIQALVRGNVVRNEIVVMSKAAAEIQKVIRGKIARRKAEEYRLKKVMGVLVTRVFHGGKEISGRYLKLQVLRSGNNYLVSGFDPETCETYTGLVKEQQIDELIRSFPFGPKQVKGSSGKRFPSQPLRKSETERVIGLLMSKLILVPRIKALGEFEQFKSSSTIVLTYENDCR